MNVVRVYSRHMCQLIGLPCVCVRDVCFPVFTARGDNIIFTESGTAFLLERQ